MYDSRVGRFFKIDPWTNKYPWQSPYVYHTNNPILNIDWDGYGDPPVKEINLKKEGTKSFILTKSKMKPFVSGDKSLSNAGEDMNKPNTTEITINAQFLQKDRETNQGISYADGKSLGGASQKEWYYIAQDVKGNYTFGKGDPPKGSYNAIGGARPLIVDGLPIGEINKYTSDAPKGLPETGDPGAENMKYLTQKSANYFARQNTTTVGKTIVAHNPTSNQIMIIVQEHDTNGYNMDTLRNYLVKGGFTNAISFDGSDSSLLIKDTETLIDNGYLKDQFCNSGATFSCSKK